LKANGYEGLEVARPRPLPGQQTIGVS
jgi:hypothetical protein